MYLIANLCLVQQVSATWYFLVVAFSLPLANICLSSRVIMGDVAGHFETSYIYGLCVISIGMLLYLRGIALRVPSQQGPDVAPTAATINTTESPDAPK